MKFVTICRCDLGLYSLKPQLQRHPIKSYNLKKTVQSKLLRSLPLRNVYNFNEKPRSQRHLGNIHFLSTILNTGIATLATVYILDAVAQFSFNRRKSSSSDHG